MAFHARLFPVTREVGAKNSPSLKRVEASGSHTGAELTLMEDLPLAPIGLPGLVAQWTRAGSNLI